MAIATPWTKTTSAVAAWARRSAAPGVALAPVALGGSVGASIPPRVAHRKAMIRGNRSVEGGAVLTGAPEEAGANVTTAPELELSPDDPLEHATSAAPASPRAIRRPARPN